MAPGVAARLVRVAAGLVVLTMFVAGAVVGLGFASNLGGGFALDGATLAPSTGAAETVTPATTPDYFPLSPRTMKYGNISMYPNGIQLDRDHPYVFSLIAYAMTIEAKDIRADGTMWLTLAMRGGPLVQSDDKQAVTNFDGSTQELFLFEGRDKTKPNLQVLMRFKPGIPLIQDGIDMRSRLDLNSLDSMLTVGSARYDYEVFLNNISPENIPAFTQLSSSVGRETLRMSFTATEIALNSQQT
jgi:hypothetical protein